MLLLITSLGPKFCEIGVIYLILPKGKQKLTQTHGISKLWTSTWTDSKFQPFSSTLQCFCGSVVAFWTRTCLEGTFYFSWICCCSSKTMCPKDAGQIVKAGKDGDQVVVPYFSSFLVWKAHISSMLPYFIYLGYSSSLLRIPRKSRGQNKGHTYSLLA